MLPTARLLSLVLFLVSFIIVPPALASESDHKYQADDKVTLWVNKVGPYNNPQETYNYYSLPFCHTSGTTHKWGGLGEVLGGNELIDSQIDLRFQKNVDKGSICELELDETKVKQFKDAIENNYWFEFFIACFCIKKTMHEVMWAYFSVFHDIKMTCLYGVLLVSYIPAETVITSMCFTHIRILILNTTRTRSFMLISLRRAQSPWKPGEP